MGVDSAAIDARAGHEACGVKVGPGCVEESLAGLRDDAPHISDLAPLVWRAPEVAAAVPVGGGRAWPGYETTRHTSAT